MHNAFYLYFHGTPSSNNFGEVANTHVPLSPSSIIWYRPNGGDALRPGR